MLVKKLKKMFCDSCICDHFSFLMSSGCHGRVGYILIKQMPLMSLLVAYKMWWLINILS